MRRGTLSAERDTASGRFPGFRPRTGVAGLSRTHQMLAPATRPRQALLLLNRRAGPGNAQLPELIEVLRAGGVHVTAPELVDRESVSAAIRAHAAEVDLVVVGGG